MSETNLPQPIANDDPQALREAIEAHLRVLYDSGIEAIAEKILQRLDAHPAGAGADGRLWTQGDVLLITYGNSIIEPYTHPLKTLDKFLGTFVQDGVSTVHILPFFPFSSDDGFSVIDYRKVNPQLGDWDDVKQIASRYRLMFDLVINHVSRESLWFYDFVGDIPPARDYFIELPQDTDVSMVTRPRNTPLLASVNTHRGIKFLWATFSEDQIDLNFANPDVLVEFVDILLYYLSQGARMIRLDAIAFLWKQLGTSCVHLPQTHEVVKLMRTLFEYRYPACILLTETNVPHAENLSYFGKGDEAHMVYQFALPPLVLYTMNRGNATELTQWAGALGTLPKHCTYLNFTASHDGIGLRALEGIISAREVADLIDCMHRFGGFVSMKANPNGEDSPYEINISLFDAMQGTRRGPDQWQVPRFVCSQAIMLAMQGIPALYIHSLVATPNDRHGVELSGRTRSINRKSWDYDELLSMLESPNTPNHEVYKALMHLLAIRRQEPCFNPDNPQEVIDVSSGLFVVLRGCVDSDRVMLCIHNVTASPQTVTMRERPELSDAAEWRDLISGEVLPDILPCTTLQPYQVLWLCETRFD